MQTHNRVPAPPWTAATCTMNTPNMCPTAYLSGIFVDSDTRRRVPVGLPGRARDRRAVDPGAREDQGNRRSHQRLAAAADPRQRPPRRRPGRAGRDGPGRRQLPDRRVEDLSAGDGGARAGQRRLRAARSSSAPASSASASSPSHRGIGSDNGAWTGLYSPRDVVLGRGRQPRREVPRLPLRLAVGRRRGPPVQHRRRRAAGRRSPDQGGDRQRPRPDQQRVRGARHHLVQPDEQHERRGARARQAAQVPRARSDPVGDRLATTTAARNRRSRRSARSRSRIRCRRCTAIRRSPPR